MTAGKLAKIVPTVFATSLTLVTEGELGSSSAKQLYLRLLVLLSVRVTVIDSESVVTSDYWILCNGTRTDFVGCTTNPKCCMSVSISSMFCMQSCSEPPTRSESSRKAVDVCPFFWSDANTGLKSFVNSSGAIAKPFGRALYWNVHPFHMNLSSFLCSGSGQTIQSYWSKVTVVGDQLQSSVESLKLEVKIRDLFIKLFQV